jgi:hypothetical protein
MTDKPYLLHGDDDHVDDIDFSNVEDTSCRFKAIKFGPGYSGRVPKCKEPYKTRWRPLSFNIVKQILLKDGEERKKIKVYRNVTIECIPNCFSGYITKTYEDSKTQFQLQVEKRYFVDFLHNVVDVDEIKNEGWATCLGGKRRQEISEYYFDDLKFDQSLSSEYGDDDIVDDIRFENVGNGDFEDVSNNFFAVKRAPATGAVRVSVNEPYKSKWERLSQYYIKKILLMESNIKRRHIKVYQGVNDSGKEHFLGGYITKIDKKNENNFQLYVEKVYNVGTRTWENYVLKNWKNSTVAKNIEENISNYYFDIGKYNEYDNDEPLIKPLHVTKWENLTLEIVKEILLKNKVQRRKIKVYQNDSFDDNCIYAGHITKMYLDDLGKFRLRLEKIYNMNEKVWKNYTGKKQFRQCISFYCYDKIKYKEEYEAEDLSENFSNLKLSTFDSPSEDNDSDRDDDEKTIINELYETKWCQLTFDVARQILTKSKKQQRKIKVFGEQSLDNDYFAGYISKIYSKERTKFQLRVENFYDLNERVWRKHSDCIKLKQNLKHFYYDMSAFEDVEEEEEKRRLLKAYKLKFKVQGDYNLKSMRDSDHGRTDYGQNEHNDNDNNYDPMVYSSLEAANTAAKIKFKKLVYVFYRGMRHGRPPKAKNAYRELINGDDKLAHYRTKIEFKTNNRIELWFNVHVYVQKITIIGVEPKNPHSDSSSGEDDDPNINFCERQDGYYDDY